MPPSSDIVPDHTFMLEGQGITRSHITRVITDDIGSLLHAHSPVGAGNFTRRAQAARTHVTAI